MITQMVKSEIDLVPVPFPGRATAISHLTREIPISG